MVLGAPVDAFDTIGLTLAANDKEIAGRTTLQKLIYFETVMIPEISLAEPYVAYFYGPFNSDVANSLEQMVFYGILDEHRIGINHGSYVYKVAPKGTKIVNRLENELRQTFAKVKELVDLCDKYCKLAPNPLSFAAKVHYMLASQTAIKKPLPEDELVQLGKSFGWKISKSDIKNGSELLEQLELVKIQR